MPIILSKMNFRRFETFKEIIQTYVGIHLCNWYKHFSHLMSSSQQSVKQCCYANTVVLNTDGNIAVFHNFVLVAFLV